MSLSVWSALGGLVLLVLLPMISCSHDNKEDQRFKIYLAMLECVEKIKNATRPDDGEKYCPPVWDNIMCWPNYTKAGHTVQQNCAQYIQGFHMTEKAERYCQLNGEWQKHPDHKVGNNSWTNFTFCYGSDVPPVLLDNMFIITMISKVGYSVSLVFLILATLIMLFLKRLHCQRNTIHINLFISFIFRAVTCLLRDGLLVNGVALPNDITVRDDGVIVFTEGSHWECKLLFTLNFYSFLANYMWIFVEGLYLHTLVFFAVFSQSKKFFKIYIIIGWVCPLVFIVIWIIVRVNEDNTHCWNTHDKGFYWIIDAPIIFSIIINFVFFLNIIRMLFTKIRNTNTRDPRRYKKLAKSTLVLIPLFGVYYVYFIVTNNLKDLHISIINIYIEMFLNSFQGTVIAILFCFINGEVRAEILKKWNRQKLRRHSVVSGRSSRAFSTTSFYIGRERASLSQGTTLPDIFSRDASALTPPNSPLNNNNAPKFHKVASMPKMPFGSFNLPKPIPRVSSSPKVTFSCSEPHVDIDQNPGGTSPKRKDEHLSNGQARSPEREELKTLLTNGSLLSKKDISESPGIRSNLKGRDQMAAKSRGGTGDGSPRMLHVSSATALPPVMDEEEEGVETSQML